MMKSIGVKRQRSTEDHANYERTKKTKKFKADDPYLSVFALPELVENIIKHLISYPKAILNISGVSKMHNSLIQSNATWVRLGFSSNIFQGSKLSKSFLKAVLAQIRFRHKFKKLARLYSDISCIEESYLRSVYGRELNQPKVLEFAANNYLSDGAAVALLRILCNTSKRVVSLEDLIGWLEEDPRIPPTPASGTRLVPISEHSFKPVTVDFDRRNCSVHATNILVKMECAGDHFAEREIVLRRILSDPTKTLLFISIVDDISMAGPSFIKYDRVKKIIEYCGDLCTFVTYKFRYGWDKALNFLCETNEPEHWAKAYLERYDICFDDDFDSNDSEYNTCMAEEAYKKEVVESVPFLRRM